MNNAQTKIIESIEKYEQYPNKHSAKATLINVFMCASSMGTPNTSFFNKIYKHARIVKQKEYDSNHPEYQRAIQSIKNILKDYTKNK